MNSCPSLRRLHALAQAVALASLAVGSACANPISSEVSGLALTGPAEAQPADGFTPVTLTATVVPRTLVGTVTFSVTGTGGALSATNAAIVDGIATVTLFAPREDTLTGPTGLTTVTAEIPLVSGESIKGVTEIQWTLPTEGLPPLLSLQADPQYVVVGAGAQTTLIIEGRRLTSTTVSLAANSDAITIPSELVLEGTEALATKSIVIDAPAEPAVVDVTLSGAGAPDVTLTLHFIEEGDDAFNVSGTFAQVTFARKRISNFWMLADDPDCVGADSIQLVNITQNGDEITIDSETCALTMPTVRLAIGPFPFEHTPDVTPGFIRASNMRDPGPMTFSVAGGVFDVPSDQLRPFFMGVNLDDPVDEALPTTDTDSRWADDDEDSIPGVTIPGKDLAPATYLASRTFTDEMTGTVESSNVLHGSISTRSESVLYDSDEAGPTIDDVPSPFHLLRVDGTNTDLDIKGRAGNPEEITCDDVILFQGELVAYFESLRPALICD